MFASTILELECLGLSLWLHPGEFQLGRADPSQGGSAWSGQSAQRIFLPFIGCSR